MILSIVVIILVGLVAYLHYIQGLLSGLISVVLALIASAMAMSYYEWLAETLSGGKFNDTAQGICLLAIFALVYLVGRTVFDKFVPGNVRLPHLVNSIGGAVLGLFAGIIAMGTIVIALQSMPFGPSIAGYARYPLAAESERQVTIPPSETQRSVDRLVIDQIKNDDLEKESTGLLLLPVDDIVVGLTKRLSSTGSLATGKPFESIHPDLMQELFGQRIGIEIGAKHTASNAKDTQVSVEQVHVLPPLPRMIGEFASIWADAPKGTLAPEPGRKLISITVMFGKEAADENFIVRVSPGSVRLVAPKSEDEPKEWKNYFAIGTVQGGKAWMNRADDSLFIEVKGENRGAHFIFMVDDSALVSRPSGKTIAGKPAMSYSMAPGTFIEVKRLVKLPLEDVKVEVGMPAENPKYYPLRKTVFYKEDAKPPETAAVTPTPPSTPTPESRRSTPPTTPNPADNGWAEAPLEKPVLVVGNQLPVGIGVGSADADVLAAGASGHLTAKQFDALEVDPSNDAAALTELPKAGNPVQQLAVPSGKRMLQVTMSIKAGADSWAWAANLGDCSVADAAGTAYKPSGVLALAGAAGPTQKLLASYKSAGEITTLKKVEGTTLTSVTLLYLVPTDQKATELRYQGKAGGLPLEK